MKKKTMIALLLVSLFSTASALAKESSCVSCHKTKHNFIDWKKSIHAAAGVTCSECHGGNPDSVDTVKAHQGVLPSSDPKSSLYFQNIPSTCGRCHAGELREFQKSAHFKNLERNGKGPNCLTCHGAMATTILSQSDMEQTCSFCHGKPTQAAKALSLLHSAKGLLALYQKQLSAPDEKTKQQFQERYRKIQAQWHSFDVTSLIAESDQLIQDLKKAIDASKKPKGKK